MSLTIKASRTHKRAAALGVGCKGMASTNAITFYISPGWRRAWLLALPMALFLALAWPHVLVAISFATQLAFFLVLLVLAATVTVTSQGIRLYRINRLIWSDIRAVKPRSVLGLPYLHVTRTKGASWWLPLYLRNEQGFYASVIANAPVGNPLRSYAESVYTQPGAQADGPAFGGPAA